MRLARPSVRMSVRLSCAKYRFQNGLPCIIIQV